MRKSKLKEISKKEVFEALKETKTGKHAKLPGIEERSMVRGLRRCVFLHKGKVREDWSVYLIMKGDRNECTIYRGFSFLCIP